MCAVSSGGCCLCLPRGCKGRKRTLHFIGSFAAAVVNIIYFHQSDALTWDLEGEVWPRSSAHSCSVPSSSAATIVVFTQQCSDTESPALERCREEGEGHDKILALGCWRPVSGWQPWYVTRTKSSSSGRDFCLSTTGGAQTAISVPIL